MQTTLCLDFGNTRLKYAVFTGSAFSVAGVIENDDTETIEKLLEECKPSKSILSSVINHNAVAEELLAAKTKFHKLGTGSKLPFTTPVNKPETIGADRLALVAAAVNLHPAMHSLVIGLGSCITYNFINKFHQFLGGGISPGLEMRLRAMHEFTAKLPLIKPDSNIPLVGYDTRTNILSGVILGISREMDGIIGEYELKYSNFNVLLTGGDMAFFAPHLKKKIFADPYLIYKGLYAISETNNVP
ncbi:MAG TPA: type III pantothenate kinase [Chitinophagaceae bacterium]|nr:type III pantothenate kinase [Chitinophagaceae bacterium]